jgi:serine/threonine-protein kinase
MLYEMLVGFPPFDGADSYSVGYKQVHETAVSPEVIDSRIPPELAAIVMKCLSKTADERYQTGFQLSDALQTFLTAAATADESRLAFYARHTGATATATDL